MRQLGRAVADLDARVLAGAAHPDASAAGTACSSALVTSSETPSSAHSMRSSRPMSWQVSTTHRRASCTPRGPEPRDRAGLFSGTVGLHGKADQRCCQSRLVYPADFGPKPSDRPIGSAVQTGRGHGTRSCGRRCDRTTTRRLRESGRGAEQWVLRSVFSWHDPTSGSERSVMAATEAAADQPGIRPAPGGGHRLRVRGSVRHQGAASLRRRRHDGRQDDPPPLPAAALPGGDRHPVPGRDRAADPRDPERPEERPGPAR